MLPVRVARAREGRGLDVQLGSSVYGRAHVTEVTDEWVQDPLAVHEIGAHVRAVITAVPKVTGKGGKSASEMIEVTLRPAAVAAALSSAATDEHVRPRSASEVEAGELQRGYVKAISDKGCFVSLSQQVDGFIGVRYVADEFVKAEDLETLVPIGALVVARALPRSDSQRGALPLSLRRSDVEGGAYVEPRKGSLTFEDLHQGMLIAGKVKSVTDFGIFVRLDGSSIDALCHKTEVSGAVNPPHPCARDADALKLMASCP